jgi:hypothetical protein
VSDTAQVELKSERVYAPAPGPPTPQLPQSPFPPLPGFPPLPLQLFAKLQAGAYTPSHLSST